MDTVIYFIRHAQSRVSVRQRHHEWPLSDLGRVQAAQLAPLLAPLQMERVISSPFIRCLDTVAPFIAASKLPLELHDGLRERYVSDAIVDDFYASEIWKKSWADFHFCVPGCESSFLAQARFAEAVAELVDRHSGSVIGISTHGNVLGLFLNFIDARFHLAEAEKIRNPDVLKIVARAGRYHWHQEFSVPGLEGVATHHAVAPVER
jgi:2,3-bisphosphoglycerate-dependent phosphoglycerate mutase